MKVTMELTEFVTFMRDPDGLWSIPMTDEQYLKAFQVVIEGSLEDAQAAFKKTPSSDNWNEVTKVMWAYQFFNQPAGREWALSNLKMQGIGYWVDMLHEEITRFRETPDDDIPF